MSSSGYLVSPSVDPRQERIWVETWKRIDRFLPDLRKELDLEPKKETAEKSAKPTETSGRKSADKSSENETASP